MAMSGAPAHFTILGAGIVGVCCALHLQRDGHRVTLIDRLEPGAGTSSGNAGLIQVDSCVPLATPGVLREVPRMLMDPEGPLVIRWRYLLRLLPWLARFALNARTGRMEASSLSLMTLLSRAKEGYAPLLRDSGAGALLRDTGELFVYGSEAAYRAAARGHELRRRRGVRLENLEGAALRDLEPALSPTVQYGVFSPDCQMVTDPLALTRSLVHHVAANGGEILRAEVHAIERDESGPTRLVTDAGPVAVERLVIAAGAYSRPFAARFGASLPLETERGYHLMLPSPGTTPHVPVLVGDRRFGIVPMAAGVRLAGTVELAGLKAPPDYRRSRMLLPLARSVMPGLEDAGATTWMGYRPSFPDSLPVIDRAPDSERVLLAFGHGHLGLTLAGITGRMIADFAAGRPGAENSEAFGVARFRRRFG